MIKGATFIYVDTSVFMTCFRNADEDLRILIESSRVAISRYVRLELLQGVRKEEASILRDTLSGVLTFEPPADFLRGVEESLLIIRTPRSRAAVKYSQTVEADTGS